ncbi:MAG: RNA methyltransferase [Thermoplasmatota archaeon]
MPGSEVAASSHEFVLVLVQPLYQGNIGSVARLARNFGIGEIVLVDPPEIKDEAIAYSMHGKELLLNARTVSTFEEAVEGIDWVVGTSGISDSGEKCYIRNPLTPDEFIKWLRSVNGRIGMVLGREDKGLLKEELEACDILVTIPASPEYPILNISHAASILLYEIWKGAGITPRRNSPAISSKEKVVLLEHYERLMAASRVPEHKKAISRTNFRRMIARAAPSQREFNSLMGTFSRAMDYKRRSKKKEE